jgi:hypothetical protein
MRAISPVKFLQAINIPFTLPQFKLPVYLHAFPRQFFTVAKYLAIILFFSPPNEIASRQQQAGKAGTMKAASFNVCFVFLLVTRGNRVNCAFEVIVTIMKLLKKKKRSRFRRYLSMKTGFLSYFISFPARNDESKKKKKGRERRCCKM